MGDQEDPNQSSDTDGDDCNRRSRRQMKRCCRSSFRSTPKRRSSVDSNICSDDDLSSILSMDKYMKYLTEKAERTEPPVLETNVNNDSQLTDEILTVNGESLSAPITDGLLNVTGVLQELPLPAPLPDDTGHHSLVSHLPSEETWWHLKIPDSDIIPKLIDSLCNTTTQHLEMVNESDWEESHIGKMPILLKTLLEEKPDIFKNSLHGLDQDNKKEFLLENEKCDTTPNNPRELSDNLHQISSKEKKSMNILSQPRKRSIECSSLMSFQNNSNDSSSFTPQVSNSSSFIVESSVPVVTSTKMSVVEQCQCVLNIKPPEILQSKIYEEESVRRMHNALPNSTVYGSQTNKKTENFNQLANKQNNFHEKRASVPDELSIFYLDDQTVSETSVKWFLMGKEKSSSQDYELSDNRNKSLKESYSEIYKEVNPNCIPDLIVQAPNGFKTITQHGMKTNNTDIGEKTPPISYHPVVVLPKLSVKDINIAEKSVEQFTRRNRKTAYFPENTDIGIKTPPISFHPVVVLRKLSVKDINIAENSVEQFIMRNRQTASFREELHKESNYQNIYFLKKSNKRLCSRQNFLLNSSLNNSNQVSKSSRSSSNLNNLIKGSISPLSPSIHNHLKKCAPSIALLNNSNVGSLSSTSSTTLKLRRSPRIVSLLTNFSDKSSRTSILNNSSESPISSTSSSTPKLLRRLAPAISLLNNSNVGSLSSPPSSTLKLTSSPCIVSLLKHSTEISKSSTLNNSNDGSILSPSYTNPDLLRVDFFAQIDEETETDQNSIKSSNSKHKKNDESCVEEHQLKQFTQNEVSKSSLSSYVLNNSSEESISPPSSSTPKHPRRFAPSISLLNNCNVGSLPPPTSSTFKLCRSPCIVSFPKNFSEISESSRSSSTLNNSNESSISSPSSNIPKRLRVKFSAQIDEDTESDQNCNISSNSEDEKIDEPYREVYQTKQVTQSIPRKEVKNKTSEKKLTSKILAVEDNIKAANIYQHVYRVVDDSEEDIDFSTENSEDIESDQNCTKSSHSEDDKKIDESQMEVSETEEVTLSIQKKEFKNKTSQTKLTGDLLAVEDLLSSNNYQNIYRIVDDSMEDSDFSTEIDEDTESDHSYTKSSNSEDENSTNLTEKYLKKNKLHNKYQN